MPMVHLSNLVVKSLIGNNLWLAFLLANASAETKKRPFFATGRENAPICCPLSTQYQGIGFPRLWALGQARDIEAEFARYLS